MAVTGATQALIAAFTFGILVNAASAALVLVTKGYGLAIFRNGLRLALVIFLASSALWAQIAFVSTAIDTTASTACQVTATFSTIFDQVARVAIEQYLVFVAHQDGKTPLGIVPQLMILARFIVGIVFVVFTRSEFQPTCVPTSSQVPVAITVIAMDATILVMLAVQFLSGGQGKNTQDSRERTDRVKSFIGFIAGVAIWMGTSITMLLGFSTIGLFFKTTMPTIGLMILIVIATLLSESLTMSLSPTPGLPTAGRPDGSRDLSSSDSSYNPPTRYEDVKFNRSAPFAAAQNSSNIRRTVSKPIKAGLGIGGKLAISYPIVTETNSIGSPLSRIPTIDLAAAAENDRRRRAADLQNASYLAANLAAPLPPSIPSASLSMAANTKRKDVAPADLSRTDSGKSNQASEMLSVQGNALSSSAQLSPGTDALRRRSPRSTQASYTQPSSTKKAFEPIRPGEPIRIPIPQAKPASDSSSENSQTSEGTQETAKTPLQRRPTNGLPSNPRAAAMRDAAKHARSKTEQTVMLVNNITYDDPGAASSALNRSNTLPVDTRSSVVHRPRPIPRKSDKEDRQVFPAEISPPTAHRRAKSGGSVVSKKSILKSMPGSPTELPPLPPPPKSAGAISRPLPNNTKSMTFDEKMELFYAPPSSATSNDPETKRSTGADDVVQRRSAVTSISSVRTTDVFDVPAEMPQPITRNNSTESLQPAMPVVSRWSDDPSQDDTNRGSSPVIPYRQSNMTGREEDAMTNWGSVHSPVAVVNVRQARLNARSTYIQKDLRPTEQPSRNVPSFNGQPVSGEVVTVMLDTSEEESRQPSDSEEQYSVMKTLQERQNSRQFHRRVGDACPTFSGRSQAQSRKMPPPAPLLLNVKGNQKAIIIQPAEPSPLESPEVAYQMIQTQLKKLEELNENAENATDRMTLLQNLELEMAGQQDKWQTLQMNINRDSMSTVKTSTPSRGSRPSSTFAAQSQRTSQRFNSSDYIASRRASRQSGIVARSKEEEVPELIMKHNNLNVLAVSKATLGSPTPPDSDESDFEAEDEQIPQDSSAVVPNTTSPRKLWELNSIVSAPIHYGLWNASVVVVAGVDYELPGLSLRLKIRKTHEPLTIESSRMWQREMWTSELNPTSGLWQKRVPIQRQEAQKVANRPLTIRPPRKSKRFTHLPDILESPEPLDKRGTLGIFRLPTGEKSENATVQYRPSQMFMAMPGTMTTGAPVINAILQARVEQIQNAEPTSYFDEFDEESGDNFDDFSDGEDLGDEFDETTLWEIANLLKTENVPSRDSLIAPAFTPSERVDSQVLEEGFDVGSDDEFDDEFDDESDYASVVDFEMVSETSTLTRNAPLVLSQPAPAQLLWTQETFDNENARHPGLPQPDIKVWNAYVTETRESAENKRSRSHTSEILPIHNTSLWAPSVKNTRVSPSTGIWTKPSVTTRAETKTSLLWNEPSLHIKSPLSGLFKVASRSNYRTTSAEPAALYMIRAPRAIHEPLQQLTTTALWSISESSAVTSGRSLLHHLHNTGSPVKQAGKPVIVTSKLLWAKPASSSMEVSDGLFDTRSKRSDYRRTTQPPAAVSMTRKPSIRKEPVAELTSKKLWDVHASSKPISTSTKPSLWIKAVAVTPTAKGLFTVDPERKVYRTTTAEPAALQMERRPRKLRSYLQELESSSLWVMGKVSVELDWLTISSIRPSSPSVASVSTDSTASSPMSDVFSVKTNITKASTVAESAKSGRSIFGGWFGKSKQDKTPEVPEVPRLPEALMTKNLDVVHPEKPARVPLRKLYHSDVTYPASWDAALREAVAASYPVKRAIPRAPPAVWDAQLHEAIQASYPQHQQTRITASPQEWSAALNIAIAASHTQNRSDESSSNTLWTKPTAMPTQAPNGLWAANSATAPSLPELSIETTRLQRSRASNESDRRSSIVEVSPEFHGQRLWRRRDHNPSMRGIGSSARDWLDDTTKRRFSRLELRY